MTYTQALVSTIHAQPHYPRPFEKGPYRIFSTSSRFALEKTGTFRLLGLFLLFTLKRDYFSTKWYIICLPLLPINHTRPPWTRTLYKTNLTIRVQSWLRSERKKKIILINYDTMFAFRQLIKTTDVYNFDHLVVNHMFARGLISIFSFIFSEFKDVWRGWLAAKVGI